MADDIGEGITSLPRRLMTARPQGTAVRLLTSGADTCLDWTDHHPDAAESSALPNWDNRFLVNAAFVRLPSLGRKRSCTKERTHTPSPIERLHWLPE